MKYEAPSIKISSFCRANILTDSEVTNLSSALDKADDLVKSSNDSGTQALSVRVVF
jgi:hypothetical protein